MQPPLHPRSSSRLNHVERWFRVITDGAIRPGAFPSAPDFIALTETYLKANSDDPKIFVWVASAESILEEVRRGRVVLEAIGHRKRTTATSSTPPARFVQTAWGRITITGLEGKSVDSRGLTKRRRRC
jgi:hypothetical protein